MRLAHFYCHIIFFISACRKALYCLELEPALYKDASRFLVERCGQAVFNAADRAINILDACTEREFLEVIGNAKDGLVRFEPDIIIFRMAIAERKAERAWLPGQANIIGRVIPVSEAVI